MNELIAKMQKRVSDLAPESPRLKKALIDIGLVVRSAAMFEARRQKISDSGTLINSIRYELFRKGNEYGVQVGPYGVKYAKYHEYGATMTPRAMRGMFAALRKRSQFRPNRASKNVVTGNAQTGGRIRARPFMRPAIAKNQKFIIDTLRAAVSFVKA